MTSDPYKSLNTKLAWASLLVLVAVLTVIFGYMNGCGSQKPGERVIVVEPAPTPEPSPVPTPAPTPTPPPTCDKVTFAQVQPLLTAKCVECHGVPGSSFDSYDVAKANIAAFIARVNILGNSPNRMPRSPKPELSGEEKALLKAWKDGGLVHAASDCHPQPGPEPQGFMDLDTVEGYILSDLNRPGSAAQDLPFTRYVVAAHKVDSGASAADLSAVAAGVDKALNSLNSTLSDIVLATPIDPAHSIFRVDLRSYGLRSEDWDTVLTADRFKIVSNTDKGRQIRAVLGVNQPWLHFDNLLLAANTPAVYYKLLRVSQKFDAFTQDVGANYKEDLANGDAVLAGFNGSPITELKNRLLSRHDIVSGGKQSYLWVTYDVAAPADAAAQNLFQFPLLKDTGSRNAVYNFQASEAIWGLPNGLQGYALFDAAGNRLNAAAQNIVTDNRSPITTEIRTAISCHRCHEGGLLTAPDQVRDHVLANASEFQRDDVDLVSLLYVPANSLAATFTRDNAQFARALAAVHANPLADPVNLATDYLQLDWSAAKVAAFLFLTEEQFKAGLLQSAQGKLQVGQLLTGGAVTFDKLVQVFPTLVKDLRLFEQPLDP